MKKFWNWIRDDSGGRVLRLEGPIDSEGFWGDEVTPQSFRDELESGEGDIIVWINSQGGNVFAAAEIYTMLRDYPGTVTVRIASYAASAATVVAMAGDVIQMSPTAVIIVHDPMTIAMGNTRDMEKAIEMLNKVKESIINAYMAKTGLSHSRIYKLMENETCITAKEAVQLGFADEILFENRQEGSLEDEPDEKERSGQESGTGEEEKSVQPEDRDKIAANLFSTRKMNRTILNSLGIADASDDPVPERMTGKSERLVQPAADKPSDNESVMQEKLMADRMPVVAEAPPVPIIGMDGKTRDGAMPYELLKKQLDYLK